MRTSQPKEAYMHARVTRYEGAAPDAVEETLQAKKGVLPTEFGQTEGMKGVVFLVDRQGGTVVVISLWQDEEAMRGSEDEATRVREEVTGPGETASVERYEVALLSVEQAGQVS
jgi:heme-degrading monooxygenase HmoA